MKNLYVDANISKAKTLATDFYTGQEHLAAAKEKIFAPSWQFIGSKETVKYAGDVHPFVLLPGYMDEPLMLTKDSEAEIHCLSNVCTHRGNLVSYKACSKAGSLRCSDLDKVETGTHHFHRLIAGSMK